MKDGLVRQSLLFESKGYGNIALTFSPQCKRKLDEKSTQNAVAENFHVQTLKQYLPPWEAFAHPKCGLYQDWYLVEWLAPFDKEDYSHTENGGPSLGTTFEPDSVLHPDLDFLKLQAKNERLKIQKMRDL